MKIWKIFNNLGQCLEMRTLPDHIVMPSPWVLLGEEETAQYFLENPIPENPPPVKEVPAEIPLWAFRSSLLLNGLEGQVMTLINSLQEPQKSVATIQWEYGNFIVRNHPIIISLSSALGLTSNQVDDIFITGSLLT
jgi:hypothetical protein